MPVLPDGKPLPVRRKDAAYDTDKNRAARKGRLSPPFSVKFFRLPAVKVPERQVCQAHRAALVLKSHPHRYPHNNAPDGAPVSLAPMH